MKCFCGSRGVESFLFGIILVHSLQLSSVECDKTTTLNLRDHNFLASINQQLDESQLVKRFYSENDVDYFQLLDHDPNYLVVGGADSLHNISVKSFQCSSTYKWEASATDREDCLMKNVDQEVCRNYIRGMLRVSSGKRTVLCGTNAYQPTCRKVEMNTEESAGSRGQGRSLAEFPGLGLVALDPRHNTTLHVDGDNIYAATVADFAGMDSLIFRRNVSGVDRGLRTQRNNPLVLNRPQFVGVLHSEEYVYFFFREEAIEAAESTTYSRVARVCKKDRGGPRNYYEAEWTTFVKARLNCSIPEKNKPFYFDEIVSISNLVKTKDGRSLFYATFVSEFNFLRYSVICAYDLAAIERLFAVSDALVVTDAGRVRRWTRKRRDGNMVKLGQCQPDSRQLTETEAITLRDYPLLADATVNEFAHGAAGIYRGSDHYNQIVVLQDVEFHDGIVDVLYVGTDQGNVIKLINLASFSDGKGGSTKLPTADNAERAEEDPLLVVAVYQVSKQPIRRLLITKTGAAQQHRYLIVVTDSTVHRLPLNFCRTLDTCERCIQSRDPHCVWHNFRCEEYTQIGKTKYVYQDVLAKRANMCAEVASHEGQEHRVSSSPLSTVLAISEAGVSAEAVHIDLAAYSSRRADNYTTYYSGKAAIPCDCVDDNTEASEALTVSRCACGVAKNGVSDQKLRMSVAASDKQFLNGLLVPRLDNNASRDSDYNHDRSSSSNSVMAGRLPAWIFAVVALALAQTIGFLYLCCWLYIARRRKRDCEDGKQAFKQHKQLVMPKTNYIMSAGYGGEKLKSSASYCHHSFTAALNDNYVMGGEGQFINAFSPNSPSTDDASNRHYPINKIDSNCNTIASYSKERGSTEKKTTSLLNNFPKLQIVNNSKTTLSMVSVAGEAAIAALATCPRVATMSLMRQHQLPEGEGTSLSDRSVQSAANVTRLSSFCGSTPMTIVSHPTMDDRNNENYDNHQTVDLTGRGVLDLLTHHKQIRRRRASDCAADTIKFACGNGRCLLSLPPTHKDHRPLADDDDEGEDVSIQLEGSTFPTTLPRPRHRHNVHVYHKQDISYLQQPPQQPINHYVNRLPQPHHHYEHHRQEDMISGVCLSQQQLITQSHVTAPMHYHSTATSPPVQNVAGGGVIVRA